VSKTTVAIKWEKDERKKTQNAILTVFVTKSAPLSAGAHSVEIAHTYINASHVCPAGRYVRNVNAIRPRNMFVDDGIRMDERRK